MGGTGARNGGGPRPASQPVDRLHAGRSVPPGPPGFPMRQLFVGVVLVLASASSAVAQSSFVNWETPQVHPLDITPDGTRLVAANTADGRIEVFDVSGASVVHLFDVAVGVD